MYSVEASTASGHLVTDYETADAAMKAVNELSVRHARNLVIRNEAGACISEQQLAMIVMEARHDMSRREGEPA